MDDVYSFLDQVFEWDRMKAARNVVKHGVRFPEAASVFFDGDALFERDMDHSLDEERYLLLGHSMRFNILLVVHVVRGDKIRLLSARHATKTERRRYEGRSG